MMPTQSDGQEFRQTTNSMSVKARAVFNIVANAGLAAGLALLSGCSGSLPANFGTSTPVGSYVQLSGSVFGGQQPIANAAIQLYTVGTSGLMSASTGLITAAPVSGKNVTDSKGKFDVSGLYGGCAGSTAGTEVYLAATGGNAGTGSVNNDIALVVALGDCVTLYNAAQAGTVHIQVNEATTVAAAYALAPFASSLTNVGASGTEPTGLANAFANAALLANSSTGNVVGAGLATGVTVPAAELNTLADILASCVNSNGGTSGDGSNCGTLFAATGVTTNTFDAALQLAKHSGKPAALALYSLVTAQSPFQPTLSGQPKDFSVAVSYAGNSSLATPYGIAIDASGNAWVTNESGTTITQFTPSGTANAAPITAAGLAGAKGIAVDKLGNVWVANTAGNSVLEFPAGNVSSPGSFTAGGISGPTGIALDSANNVFVANLNGNSVTELSNAGAALNSSPFTGGGNITVPTGIAVGSSGVVYVTSGSGSVVQLSNTGVYQSSLSDGALQGPVSVASGGGQIAVTGFTTGSAVSGVLGEFTTAGAAASVSPVSSGTASVSGVATDLTSFWAANSAASGGLLQFTYGAATAASPTGGFGNLNDPMGVATDSSGSVWTANSGSNTVSKFIGMSVPAATPVSANVGP